MATTAPFLPLSVPAPEVTMDISSPQNQMHDHDIELDFGDGEYDGGVDLLDDAMLTDGEQPRPQTGATDDVMEDDVHQDAPEAEMQDTPVEQPPAHDQYDEELIDYGDEEDLDTTIMNAEEGFNTFHEQQIDGAEKFSEEIVRLPEEPKFEQPEIGEDFPSYELVHDAAAHDPTDDTAADEATYDDAQAEQHPADLTNGDVDDLTYPAEETGKTLEQIAHPTMTIDTTSNSLADGPASPTDTGLHPVMLYYSEHSMPLFRSKHEPEGLLKNDNLVNVHLHDLMAGIRDLLVQMLGEDAVPEARDFTLSFDGLGLMLPAESTSAFQTSLKDVLDMYLMLWQNDGEQEVPPLSIVLTTQGFSGQFAMLKQAAETGTGMSQLMPKGVEEEVEEYDEVEEHENGDDEERYRRYLEQQQQADLAEGESLAPEEGHEYQQEEEYYEGDETAAENTEVVPALQEDENDYGEEDEYDQNGETNNHTHVEVPLAQESEDAYQQEEEYHEGEEYHDDDAQHYGESHDQVQASHAVPEPEAEQYAKGAEQLDQDFEHEVAAEEAYDEDVEQVADESNDGIERGAIEHNSPEPVAAAADQSNGTEEDLCGELPKAVSIASSETFKGDVAKEHAGEYHEDDLIDWDDDSSLTHLSSELAVDDQDEFAMLLKEYEADDAKAALDAQTKNYDGHGDAHDEQTLAAQNDVSDELNLDSEDFPETHEANDVHAQHDGADDLEQHEHNEENFDQADTYEEQQEAAYEGHGEDEQYHAAHEFDDGGDYEHGLERQPNGEEHAGETKHVAAVTDHDGHNGTIVDEPINFDDDIGFDDETTEQHEARKASESGFVANGTDSPLGKRTFDEHADDDLYSDDDEPDLKKVRAG
ncbi:hypothetical protein LTS10_003011 [Elasticomyces elasticus]|nr:hypothetical protein LTS10_003011 [Elasticomyces elasticus]